MKRNRYVSSAVSNTIAAALGVLIIVAAVGGYYAGTLTAPPPETVTTVVSSTVVQTKTVTQTGTVVTTTAITQTGTVTQTQVTTITTGPKKKIGLVTDIGGRGDLSFNDMGFLGSDMAAKDFNLDLIELISTTEADYRPNLRTLAKRGDCVLIVAVGFLLTDALNETATEFPEQKFAGIDIYIGNQPNVLGIGFEEHKGSAMVGAVAALLAAHYNKPHVGMALGIEIPVLWKFEIGYKFGVDWAVKWYEQKFGKPAPGIAATPPKERVLWTYTGTFSDPIKGYEAAKTQFAQGAVACYNVGGPIGLGIFQAAEEIGKAEGKTMGPPFGIGVDADQDWVRPGWVITSMMKRVDTGVYVAAKMAVEGTFKGGILILGPKENGIAMSTLEDMDTFLTLGVQAGTVKAEDRDKIFNAVKAMRDAQPAWIWEGAQELINLIKTGQIEVPLAFTAEDIAKYRAIYG